MSLSVQEVKFLLDENVHRKLETFLRLKSYDVKIAPKGFSNGKLSDLSKFEERILITNDSDFSKFSNETAFSVILLRISQSDVESLFRAFSDLLIKKPKIEDFKDKIIILRKEGFEVLSE